MSFRCPVTLACLLLVTYLSVFVIHSSNATTTTTTVAPTFRFLNGTSLGEIIDAIKQLSRSAKGMALLIQAIIILFWICMYILATNVSKSSDRSGYGISGDDVNSYYNLGYDPNKYYDIPSSLDSDKGIFQGMADLEQGPGLYEAGDKFFGYDVDSESLPYTPTTMPTDPRSKTTDLHSKKTEQRIKNNDPSYKPNTFIGRHYTKP